MPAPPDFWSRRRRAVAEDAARQDEALAAAETARAQDALAAKDDAELLDLLGLPEPESLTPADAAAFMARTIPVRLRRRAMRALFHRFPELSVPDGLLDYDDDYTDAGLADRPEPRVWNAVQRIARSIPEPEPEEAPAHTPHDPAAGAGISPPDVSLAAETDADSDSDGPEPPPRRMVFRFEDMDR